MVLSVVLPPQGRHSQSLRSVRVPLAGKFILFWQIINLQEKHANDLLQPETRGALHPNLLHFVQQHEVIIDVLHMVRHYSSRSCSNLLFQPDFPLSFSCFALPFTFLNLSLSALWNILRPTSWTRA